MFIIINFGFFMNLLPSISWSARTALAGHLETDLRDFSRNLELSLPLNPHLTPLVLSTLAILDRYISGILTGYICCKKRAGSTLHLVLVQTGPYDWMHIQYLGTSHTVQALSSPDTQCRAEPATLYLPNVAWQEHNDVQDRFQYKIITLSN